MPEPCRRTVSRRTAVSVAGCLFLAAAVPAAGPPSMPAAGVARRGADTTGLAAFVDSVIGAEMRSEHVPGAAFVFVQDGRVVYQRGYGLANVAERRAADPETTIWRIGSISKTFTALAVAQLADRGRVDLRADVNRYLTRVHVPGTYPLPVSVRDLLTHTAGLDEIRPGTQAPTGGQVLPLADFLRPRLARVRPPGETISYSTYGITLAGELVEEVSGTSYERYLRENVWGPLEMRRTSVTVPTELRRDLAMGYERQGDSLQAQEWEWYHTIPASSINSTAADMARYMVALLQRGRLGAARVLSDSAGDEMLRQQVAPHPRVPGVTLGLWEDYVGGLRVVEHGGNVAGFSSQMTLIPSENAGFFVVNHFESSHLRDNLREALLRRLYPAARTRRPVPAPPVDFAARAGAYTGRYAWMTSCHTCTPRSVPLVLDVAVRDNALFIAGNRWIEVAPLLFVRHDGTGYIAFRTDPAGRVVAMFPGSFWSFERLPDARP
ncbi:MAG: serine hydrolase domain-containing protein [Longimicrobiaceae bacterium]